MSHHRRPTDRRPARVVIAALALLVLVVTGAAGTANAAKGGNGGGGKPGGGGGGKPGPSGSYSVSLDQAAPYAFGQQVTVTTDTPMYDDGAGPYIWLKCYQGGDLVLATDHAGFPGGWYYGDPFQLGPTQSWSGGAADCTVTVVHRNNNKVVTDATTSFQVVS